jgi:hypothetical protein
VTRNQRARGSAKTKARAQQSAEADRAAAGRKNLDSMPVGGPVEHPHAAHNRRVLGMPEGIQSLIVDLGNAARSIHSPGELFALIPGAIERLEDLKATVDRLLQGPHTARGERPTVPSLGGAAAVAPEPDPSADRNMRVVGPDPRAQRTMTHLTAEPVPAGGHPTGGPSSVPAEGIEGASL